MQVVAIIQARMGSSRLPGKVMMRLIDKTVLSQVITRVRQVHRIDQIVVATTVEPGDDVIVAECRHLDVSCYRGSETDVLARYYHAALVHKADCIIRITSDCPLLDPELLTQMLSQFIKDNNEKDTVDYLSNSLLRTFPRGLDVEIFSFRALEKAQTCAVSAMEREHVTPYIYQNPQLFRLLNYQNKINLAHHRWTLDTTEDSDFILKIYEALYPHNACFSMQDILTYLQTNPALININKHIEQKEIYLKEH